MNKNIWRTRSRKLSHEKWISTHDLSRGERCTLRDLQPRWAKWWSRKRGKFFFGKDGYSLLRNRNRFERKSPRSLMWGGGGQIDVWQPSQWFSLSVSINGLHGNDLLFGIRETAIPWIKLITIKPSGLFPTLETSQEWRLITVMAIFY